ncbi:hypothetical protein L1887_38289 [Cichorium endivia]|nr:hypothetical protein L1887_38289 [Cichorium endivia]
MAPNPINIVRRFSEEEVAVALADYISRRSTKYIADYGSFSVVLSGGTLIHTLRKLVEPPYVSSIDWSKWLIFFLDERVVPLNDPESTYKLACDGFLSKVFVEGFLPEKAAKDYEQRLRDLVDNNKLRKSSITGFAKFNLMLLGMGPDGNVASLFCWHFQRFEKKKWVTFITDSPNPPPKRITFTFPLINSSSKIAMVVTGEDAADAVKVALGLHASYGYLIRCLCRRFRLKESSHGSWTWRLVQSCSD